MNEKVDDSFLAKMFKASVGKNAVNYLQQLKKRQLKFAPDHSNLGWVNHDEPNTVYLNSLYKEADQNKPIASRALETGLHEMFHSQDLLNSRKIGELGMSDEAKYLLGSELAKDINNPWNPGYNPYNESLTRLREEDMWLPQGESILNDPRVQKYIDKAWNRSKYNHAFMEDANRPKAKKAFTKALEYGLYPEQRWFEEREPTIKERISDKIKQIFSK